jgi:two-component system, sensor histidine kinase and response regulator
MDATGNCAEGVSMLYIEDDRETREILSSTLARQFRSVRLFTADNGGTGLALYREHQPEIVITDIEMPVMDGIQMVTEIKVLNPEVVTIAITARDGSQHLRDLREAGFGNIVLKPVDFGELFAVITRCIAACGRSTDSGEVSAILHRGVNEAVRG